VKWADTLCEAVLALAIPTACPVLPLA
jgi:hypothetical protein